MTPPFFNVNCTLPPTVTHYVSGASTRGTLDIIWSALTVLILCVWSNQHLNVPPQCRQRPSEKETETGSKFSQKRRKFFRHTFLFNRGMRWMAINLVSPEFLTAKALLDLISAKDMNRRLKPWARDDGVDWSMAHTYYANMGGFVIRFEDNDGGLEGKTDGDVAAAAADDDVEAGQYSSEMERVSASDHSPREGMRRPYTPRHLHSGQPSSDDIVESEEGGRPAFVQDGDRFEYVCDNNPDQLESNSGDVMQANPTEQMGYNRPAKADVLAARRMGRVFDTCRIAVDEGGETAEQGLCSAQADEHLSGLTYFTRQFDTEVAQNMKSHLNKLVGHRVWGVKRYVERTYDFRASFGFDWEIDQRNSEVVLKALDEYGQYDMREFPMMSWYHNVIALQGNSWYVDGAQLLFAREVGIITSLPSLPLELLDDQIKDNFLMKSVTLIQIIWLTLQLIARQTEGLPSAQIEIVTLAFAACSLFACVLMWGKPQGVEACFYITASRRPDSREIQTLGGIGPKTLGQKRIYPWMCNNTLHTHGKTQGWFFGLGLWTCATLFGGIHCLSWNSHFPTPVERLLWRMSCLSLTIEPFVVSVLTVYLSLRRLRKRETGKMRRKTTVDMGITNMLIHILFAPYVLSRLYLIVETVRSLAYLPPEVFVSTNWPNWLPHWG